MYNRSKKCQKTCCPHEQSWTQTNFFFLFRRLNVDMASSRRTSLSTANPNTSNLYLKNKIKAAEAKISSFLFPTVGPSSKNPGSYIFHSAVLQRLGSVPVKYPHLSNSTTPPPSSLCTSVVFKPGLFVEAQFVMIQQTVMCETGGVAL